MKRLLLILLVISLTSLVGCLPMSIFGLGKVTDELSAIKVEGEVKVAEEIDIDPTVQAGIGNKHNEIGTLLNDPEMITKLAYIGAVAIVAPYLLNVIGFTLILIIIIISFGRQRKDTNNLLKTVLNNVVDNYDKT